MKKLMYCFSLSALALFIQSCQPEPVVERANFHIVNITHHNASINDCAPSDGGANGTIFDFYVEMDSTVGYGTMPKVRFTSTFENGNVLGPKESAFPNFTYDFTFNKIEHSQCIRFASSNWADIKYEVLAPDGKPSEPYTIRVNKPAGAN